MFLDEENTVKLGDFGLSKALPQASFASTYVGVRHIFCFTIMGGLSSAQTPYYMSPELMQEKAYDSKSDIWSLGCLIYELCALKPPFHEAKTHSELSIFIRSAFLFTYAEPRITEHRSIGTVEYPLCHVGTRRPSLPSLSLC